MCVWREQNSDRSFPVDGDKNQPRKYVGGGEEKEIKEYDGEKQE